MSIEKKLELMGIFAKKNAARKENFHNTTEHRYARQQRRLVDGAFGKADKKIYNQLALGTGGGMRE